MTAGNRGQVLPLDPRFLWLVLLHFSTKASAACPIDKLENSFWGGSCRFLCKCEFSKCGVNGECVDSAKCSSGWFGPSCQYINLLDWYPQKQPGNWITDGERLSCNPRPGVTTIDVSLNTPVLFTWLRCSFSPAAKGLLSNLYLTFGDFKAPCQKKRTFFVSVVTVDITCDMRQTGFVRSLTLSGVALGYLCNLYINGGRNLAINQETEQSSVNLPVELSESDNAVDGSIQNAFFSDSCSHTNMDKVAFWRVNFDKEVTIYRVRVINRNIKQDALAGFTLRFYDRYENTLSEILASSKMLNYYDLDLGLEPPLVQHATITKENSELIVCEFMAFGEVLCPAGTWGLTCDQKCECEEYQSCFQATGVCGPACPQGSYGVNCGWKCPDACKDSVCEARTGNCIECAGRAIGDKCEKICDENLWGSTCQYACRCPQNQCSRSGDCPEGTPCLSKYFGPGCRYEDLIKLYKNSVSDPSLTDRDVSTCILGASSIRITFQEINLKFNWMRVVLAQNVSAPFYTNASYQHLFLEFDSNSLKCLNHAFYRLSTTVMDVHCYPPLSFTSLTVSGPMVSYICEIYISGNTPCPPGKYGLECSQDCFCLKDNHCSEVTGHCASGCPPGKYGTRCTLDCPSFCINQACDQEGQCISCPVGHSGPNCEFVPCNATIAPYCKNNQCISPGACNTCLGMRLGPTCILKCPSNCFNNSCSDKNHTCLGCFPGMAGPDCNQSCSTNCHGNLCNQHTFACNRCPEDESYGPVCNITCPEMCKDYRCSREKGSCLACNNGFYGSRCEDLCSSSCKDQRCEINGACHQESKKDIPSGNMWYIKYILIAIMIMSCLAVIFLYVKKRLKHEEEEGEDNE